VAIEGESEYSLLEELITRSMEPEKCFRLSIY